MPLPRYIALCGRPKAGKSTVQNIMEARYGVIPIDDGAPLRETCVAMFGVSLSDLTSQEGKRKTTLVCGHRYTNRQLLGLAGEAMEKMFGDQVIPEAAIARAERMVPGIGNRPASFSFGSVRKNQGLTYRKRGGLVIEIARPGTVIENDFDLYDEELVTHTIINDGTMQELEQKVADVLDPLRHGEQNAGWVKPFIDKVKGVI
jgi:hypothetical protein